MKKSVVFSVIAVLLAASVFAQSDEDFFFDDGIIEQDENISGDYDLSHGTLFENGSIKIGGLFSTSLGTTTTLWAEDSDDFGENLKNTTLTPTVSAFLTVDARPTQTLRMYTKFGVAYPFGSKISAYVNKNESDLPLGFDENGIIMGKKVNASFSDYIQIKELFTDFSVADRAFFRFGLHTVTWGTGYFFSPVSDMINTSSIDPENVSEQVDGALNLRTQITFPGTQNCLWLYVIPTSDYQNPLLRDTGFAGKADIVIGNWELGVGGFYKYDSAPKVMFTATGSLQKVSFFGEFVYQYGADAEWKPYNPMLAMILVPNAKTDSKTNIVQATVGFSYFWKEPSITLAAQYYYDGNDVDFAHYYVTAGHNFAVVANFGRIFGTTDVTATVFGMINYGKGEINSALKDAMQDIPLNSITTSAMLNYSPVSAFTVSAGPYLTWEAVDSKPKVAMKITAKLGGGKF